MKMSGGWAPSTLTLPSLIRSGPPALTGALAWEGTGHEWIAVCHGHAGEPREWASGNPPCSRLPRLYPHNPWTRKRGPITMVQGLSTKDIRSERSPQSTRRPTHCWQSAR
jgi:hypothetical protein